MLKQKILTGWNIPRFLRLGIGLWLLIVTAQSHNWPAALFSGLIVFMAVSNTGCCGAQGCPVPEKKNANTGEIEQ